MVKNLPDLIDDLDKITSGFISQARAEAMAMAEIEGINDVASLEEIQTATGRAETIVSAAASVRQRRIEAATLASGSTGAMLYTAPLPFEQGDTNGVTMGADVFHSEQSLHFGCETSLMRTIRRFQKLPQGASSIAVTDRSLITNCS